MLEGTVLTRKLKKITAPIRQKSIHVGQPPVDVMVAEVVADLLEKLRQHAGLYEMKGNEAADVLEKVSTSLLDIAKIVRKD